MLMCFPYPNLPLKAQEGTDCSDLIMSSQVVNTTNGVSNGSVSITAKGGITPYHYIFFYEDGHLLTKEMTQNSLSNLKAGSFYCSVVDAIGCTKKIKINIK
jgi:hypothetical protein